MSLASRSALESRLTGLATEFDERQGATRIDLRDNLIVDNNGENTAPGSALSNVPPGIGVLYQGVDNSLITKNYIQDNHFSGIAIVDYCLSTLGTPQQCCAQPGQQDCDPNVRDVLLV